MKPVSLIGMGMSPHDLTSRHLSLIESADILIAGKRHLEYFKDHAGEKKEIHKNLKMLIEYIKDRGRQASIVVLASGDPLFFGVGSFLIKSLGAENVCIYPNITSVAAAFSRLKEPWQDVHIVSIHGRFNEDDFLSHLSQYDKIAVFTEPRRDPGWLANFLLEKNIENFEICVLEHLGMKSERVAWYNLHEAAARQFADPNLVVLRRTDPRPAIQVHLGMPDNDYEHQCGLITKAEVRAVTIAKLRLFSSDHILWDLGAGSGSVSIEAALFIKKGRIFAVEQKHERIKHIAENKAQFGIRNLEIIHGEVTKAIENLPPPDRIFIGGGGRHLRDIIKTCTAFLKPEGVIVINTVLIQNLETALTAVQEMGLKTEVIQLQVSRGRAMPWGERFEAQNPVWIISGLSQ